MKIENVIKKFNTNIVYCCPKCKSNANIIDKSLICNLQHCYDFSKKGYIHLINNYKEGKYSKDLFDARSSIFKKGYYNHLLINLINILSEYNCKNIIDIGCGDGYYIRELKKVFPEKYFYGLDNSKSAIETSLKEDKINPYILANLSNIPFSNNQIDIILNILTPANYEEFFRVLTKGGIIIKVLPTKNYLRQIREVLKISDYKNEDTASLLEKNCDIIFKKIVTKDFELDFEIANNFFKMTPMTFSKEISCTDIKNLKNITIELEIVVAKIKN